jgi:hypothetical protein
MDQKKITAANRSMYQTPHAVKTIIAPAFKNGL